LISDDQEQYASEDKGQLAMASFSHLEPESIGFKRKPTLSVKPNNIRFAQWTTQRSEFGAVVNFFHGSLAKLLTSGTLLSPALPFVFVKSINHVVSSFIDRDGIPLRSTIN
jgi:hypothetical protein